MMQIQSLAYKTFHKLTQWSNPIKANPTFRLVFLHIPKCGGSSIDFAVRNHWTCFEGQLGLPSEICATQMIVGKDYSFMHPLFWNNLQSSYIRYMYHDLPIISGHFSFSRKAYEIYGDRYSYITVLRDPVERWISHYRFANMGHLMHLGEDYSSQLENHSLSLKEKLELFINSEMGFFLANLQCVALGGYNLNYNFFNQENVLTLLQNAKENLKYFKIIGFLENIEKFEEKFYETFGYKLTIPVHNKTVDKEIGKALLISQNEEIQYKVKNYEKLKLQDLEIKALFTSEVRQKIYSLCAYDYELYEAAKQIAKDSR